MPPSSVELRVTGLPSPLLLHIHGDQDQYVSRSLREQGIWEPYETALLLRLLQPGGVFIDVGANIGYFTIIAASLVGERGRVFAFEPDPANCSLLHASAQANDLERHIEVVQAGLADEAMQGRLFLSEDNFGDHQIYATREARPSVAITLVNGSDYLQGKLDRVDLLKVDTQGSEYQVMTGLLPLLKSLQAPGHIMLELTPYSLREAGASGRQLVELLAGLAQPMWIIDHIEHRLVACPPEELARWCDNVEATAGDRGFMNILVGPELAAAQ